MCVQRSYTWTHIYILVFFLYILGGAIQRELYKVSKGFAHEYIHTDILVFFLQIWDELIKTLGSS